MSPYLASWAADACYFTSASDAPLFYAVGASGSILRPEWGRLFITVYFPNQNIKDASEILRPLLKEAKNLVYNKMAKHPHMHQQ